MANKPIADYVKLPGLDEYKEWFKDYFDLRREDGILEVTMKTKGGPMYWSGGAHRAMSQLMRVISMDRENEILIWTHKGPDWMMDGDIGGWEQYEANRFEHQFNDDTDLIKNMLFDINIPTISAQQGSGFHWDSAVLCDITVCAEDVRYDDMHLQLGLVPGDGMGLLLQHLLGAKKGNYYMYTSRQFTAQQALDWGFVSEVVPKGQALDRAWEIARLLKSVPYETRMLTGIIAKRPLRKMYVEDFETSTLAEQLSSFIKVSQNEVGDPTKAQVNEGYCGSGMHWRYNPEVDTMLKPQTAETWKEIRNLGPEYTKWWEQPKYD